MLTCVTVFISDMIDHFINIFIGALVFWFLVIATQVIQAQRETDPKDDVEQEWEQIRYYMAQNIRYLLSRVKNSKTLAKIKMVAER